MEKQPAASGQTSETSRRTGIVLRTAVPFLSGESATEHLDGEFSFDPADPYAVTDRRLEAQSGSVTWTFARDLLAEGLYHPTGDGDVQVWPCLSNTGEAVVIIELCSPDGTALLQTASRRRAALRHLHLRRGSGWQRELPPEHRRAGRAAARPLTHRLISRPPVDFRGPVRHSGVANPATDRLQRGPAMTDTYIYLIRESDWDSDRFLPGGEPASQEEMATTFGAHKAFQDAVAELGARIVGGEALQSAKHGGVVTPGPG